MRLGTFYRSEILKHFQIQATKEYVLDVGSYDGYWISNQKAQKKYALDLEVNRIYDNVNYLQASALEIPFKSNHFDQVFAFDVLEHIEEGQEKKFLSELLRVCKKDGEIIVTTPSNLIAMFPRFMTNYISLKWGHAKCNGYSKAQLRDILSSFSSIEYKILDNNTPNYRLLYLILRPLWSIFQSLMKVLVAKIARTDFNNRIGDEGFYLIKIIKRHNNE